MRKFFLLLLFSYFAEYPGYGQTYKADKTVFFEDTSVLNATLTTDIIHLERQRSKEGKQYAGHFSFALRGDSLMDAPVVLETRGRMRKEICEIPPIRINFKEQKNSPLHKLGSLKLVNQCRTSNIGQDYLIREYLIYKMYNLITDMGFRVRLLKLTLADSSGRKKPVTEYAFLMEDIKDLARRNNCTEFKTTKLDQRRTDPRQMTIVAIFEYMIGNTDWGISANHNTRLIRSVDSSLVRPYVVPYDFDYAGLVNADYAVADENLGIASVRDRLYRGFPGTMDELNDVIDIFKKQKGNIYALINGCTLISPASKKDMTSYLDDFFDIINDPRSVRNTFIDNARKE